jgi:VIT1/CCC1 family predicted Fe2+/Mn2+ transporter
MSDLEHLHTNEAIAERIAGKSSVQYVSEAVLGSIDGCVTTLAIVTGATGANMSTAAALILGLANTFADGFSMAVGVYESTVADREHFEKLKRLEYDHIRKIPEGEREEVRQIYEAKGFAGELLEDVVARITSDQDLWVDTMLREEHGIMIEQKNPYKAATITFVAFVLTGLVPLMPLFVTAWDPEQRFLASCILAGIAFFGVGTLKSRVFETPFLISGLRTLLTGGSAAGLSYLVGAILHKQFGL